MSNTDVEFNQIHDTFRPKILRYLTRLVGAQEAEDLTQSVFVKVSDGLQNFREEASLSTWIYRIATNTALDWLRSGPARHAATVRSPGRRMSADDVDEDKPNASVDQEAPSVDTEAIRVEMNECIKRYINDLPHNYRTVIVLSEIEGLKNSEIADVLSVSLDTVKIRLHRARRELKKNLKGGCDFYRDERNELACDHKGDIHLTMA